MGPAIQAIDDGSILRICSGQVVVDLSVAVKELVENSLDAGASSILIRFGDSGASFVEVVDNGAGIAPGQDAEGLCLNHFTSKLRSFRDLAEADLGGARGGEQSSPSSTINLLRKEGEVGGGGVQTFGFRGEALSSLCALAGSFTVVTRTKGESTGRKLAYDRRGRLIQSDEFVGIVAREVGTTVSIRDIFSSVPVRHKEFQRNIKREYGRALQVLQAYALICTGVRIRVVNISLFHGGSGRARKEEDSMNVYTKRRSASTAAAPSGERQIFCTSCKPSVRDNFVSLFGTSSAAGMQYFNASSMSSSPRGDTDIVMCTTERIGHALAVEGELPAPILSIVGYVSRVDFTGERMTATTGGHRVSGDRQFFYVNGRPVDLPRFSRVINSLYRQFCGSHGTSATQQATFPSAIVDIRVPRGMMDINITPDKRRVFLHAEDAIINMLQVSLERLWGGLTDSKKFALNQSSLLHSFNSLPTPAEERSENAAGPLAAAHINVDQELGFQAPCVTGGALSKQVSVAQESLPYETLVEVNREDRSDHQSQCLSEFQNVSDKDTRRKRSRIPDESRPWTTKRFSAEPTKTAIDVKVDSPKKVPSKFSFKMKWLIEHVPLIHKISPLTREGEYGGALKKPPGPMPEADGSTTPGPANSSHLSPASFYEEVERSVHKSLFKKMSVVGQFNLGFIVTKLHGDLFIVDQHASDEIRNFESLQKKTVFRSQKLIHPLELELSAAEEELICENRDVFERNGFQLDIVDGGDREGDVNLPSVGRKVQLLSLPYSQNTVFNVGDAMELISQLVHLRDEATYEVTGIGARSVQDICPSKVRAMFASRACRASVMIGTALEKSKMKKIVCNLSDLDRPWNCPHGRPTMRHLATIPKVGEWDSRHW